jgi:hypothetical protein
LVKHHRRRASIGEIDIEVTAVRHILLTQGGINITQLPKQFDDRLLIGGVAPIMRKLPGSPAQAVGTQWTGLDDEGGPSRCRLRENFPIVSINRRATRGEETYESR